ncbi:Gfo/Idh/MocA family protein [Pseudonocardia humida]|uniref:Gfo/Idh/MocA family oxidoreductase n=1 Tax=Pseudonocardia humida TaxID=2800819 RepID=A0ABT0ZSP2_9PSEU|nr:Gfo/Idh/MocA family oxidoreductase [Pseudonocardia humida]MCO1653717.1 Gfo/Idh/MocA family oxidoreductase [Pseudonocardia humida]
MPPSHPSPARVLLVGAHGHGRWHLRNLDRLRRAGAPVRLAGVCEPRPLADDQLALVGGVPTGPHLTELLDAVRPEVTVVCTPIPTHVDIALAAARAGSHVLLEKPPTPSRAEFGRLVRGVAATGRACQVGFQSLGSAALAHVRALATGGAIGEVRGIGAAGAWVRDHAYWARSPWAGRRRLDGTDVVDGALTNPFAHATATALAIDGSGADPLRDVRVELYRANPIEADDTACARLTTARGTPVVVAVTLCAERHHEPFVVVHGSRGRIVLHYKSDTVRLEADDHVTVTEHPATDLLENLVAHTRDPAVALLAPLPATAAFTDVVEAVRVAPDPRPIGPGHHRTDTTGPHPREVVPGIDAAVERAAAELAPFSELDLAWAAPAVAVPRG